MKENSLLKLQGFPRKLDFIPHVRFIAFHDRFHLTNETTCSSFQFCFRFSGHTSDTLSVKINNHFFRTGYPHLMIKFPGQSIHFCNETMVNALYFSYSPDAVQFFFPNGLPLHSVLSPIMVDSCFDEVFSLLNWNEKGEDVPDFSDRMDLACLDLVCRTMLHLEQKENTERSEDQQKIQKIAAYLQAHFTENVNLDELSENYGFSLRNMLRHWSRAFHVPPGRFVAGLKLIEAKRLLTETNLSVSDIATRLGYCDDGYFCRVFRKAIGVTPAIYRKTGR